MTDSPDLGVERTLVLLKPDAVARGLAGRILTRFEDAALKVVGVKMRHLDAEFTRKHYFDLEERLGKEIYDSTAAFMQTGSVVALALQGVDAVAKVRKIIGTTYPDQAAPGTVRGLRAPNAGVLQGQRQGGHEPRTYMRPGTPRRPSTRSTCGSTARSCSSTRRSPRSSLTETNRESAW
jgi:nucleoside diphosphate kinase